MICFTITENGFAIVARTIYTKMGIEKSCALGGFSPRRGCDGKSWFQPELIYVGY